MQYAVRTPTVGAGEDGRWPITFANTFVLSVDQIQRVIPTYANKLILPAYALRLIGRSQNPLRTIGKRTRVLLCTGHAQRFAGSFGVPSGVRHTRQKCVLRRFQRGLAPSVRRSIPSDAMVRGSMFAPELLGLFILPINVTYKFQSFPRIFFMCRRHNQPPRSLW